MSVESGAVRQQRSAVMHHLVRMIRAGGTRLLVLGALPADWVATVVEAGEVQMTVVALEPTGIEDAVRGGAQRVLQRDITAPQVHRELGTSEFDTVLINRSSDDPVWLANAVRTVLRRQLLATRGQLICRVSGVGVSPHVGVPLFASGTRQLLESFGFEVLGLEEAVGTTPHDSAVLRTFRGRECASQTPGRPSPGPRDNVLIHTRATALTQQLTLGMRLSDTRRRLRRTQAEHERLQAVADDLSEKLEGVRAERDRLLQQLERARTGPTPTP